MANRYPNVILHSAHRSNAAYNEAPYIVTNDEFFKMLLTRLDEAHAGDTDHKRRIAYTFRAAYMSLRGIVRYTGFDVGSYTSTTLVSEMLIDSLMRPITVNPRDRRKRMAEALNALSHLVNIYSVEIEGAVVPHTSVSASELYSSSIEGLITTFTILNLYAVDIPALSELYTANAERATADIDWFVNSTAYSVFIDQWAASQDVFF